MIKLTAKLRGFPRERSGAVAPIAAICGMMLSLAVGISVVMGRWMMARRSMAEAVDAAVLAGARALQIESDGETVAKAVAQRVFLANTKDRFNLISNSVSFAVVDGGSAVEATGIAKMGTTFLSIAGITELEVANFSQAGAKATIANALGGSNIEISLMLDVTSSMCDDGAGPCTGGAKLGALKDAANDLVNIVVQADQGKYKSRVALVPFSTLVRVAPNGQGGSIMKKLTNLDNKWSGWYRTCTNWTGTSGGEGNGNGTCHASTVKQEKNWPVLPCVSDRFYDSTWSFDSTDDAPGPGRWLNAHDGSRRQLSYDSSDTPPTSELGLTEADPAAHYNFSPWGCSDVSESNEIMPLSSDKVELKARIDGLEAFGATGGALGTAWAWYMLSPNWDNIFSGQSKPDSYSDLTAKQPSGAPVLRKVAVLMTDGSFNAYRGWKGQDQGFVSDGALALCTNMKAKGIEVYTIGFALDELPADEKTKAINTLRACGTDVAHFYETLTPADLKAAFRDIALQVTPLYLKR